MQVATTMGNLPGTSANHGTMSNAGVPLIARVYLTLGSWKKALSPALDDDSIQGINNISFLACCTLTFCLKQYLYVFSPEILISYHNATLSAKDWGKAWHIWALFNTEVMSRYTFRGRPDIAGKYVVAAVTGYFYSIACASTTKGVDDSLQVNILFCYFCAASFTLTKGLFLNTKFTSLNMLLSHLFNSRTHLHADILRSSLIFLLPSYCFLWSG